MEVDQRENGVAGQVDAVPHPWRKTGSEKGTAARNQQQQYKRQNAGWNKQIQRLRQCGQQGLQPGLYPVIGNNKKGMQGNQADGSDPEAPVQLNHPEVVGGNPAGDRPAITQKKLPEQEKCPAQGSGFCQQLEQVEGKRRFIQTNKKQRHK
ncbi:MAG: hypothetical protein A2X45_10485 [Lentisphaerae bacterium GWF2_50_93]|nr:MAG: hypothetical protein A2X45_10485 [Lentisphaerae bacterium GWF2_50_93]